MSAPIYYQLFFTGMNVGATALTKNVQPIIYCPNCGTKGVLPTAKSYSIRVSVFDSNQQETFTCTVCGAIFIFYVALHYDPINTPHTSICFQRGDSTGIPANWWQNQR
jgi:transcription elongation factor Elf1